MDENKIQALKAWFELLPGTITAFSGGVDSSLVIFLSKRFLSSTTVACISNSASLKKKDYELAIDFCNRYGIPLEVIETREVNDENYYLNPIDRCFICKNHLYNELQIVKEKFPEYVLLNGINSDDFNDYRPGIKAAKEHGIRYPLADCKLTKQDVRDLARYFGLPNWDKPASPCLSSRIPYGQIITKQKLMQIEAAEGVLNNHGFRDVRVRHYDREARIEVPVTMIEGLREQFSTIEKGIKKVGFENCVIDEEGLISGKLNRPLKLQYD